MPEEPSFEEYEEDYVGENTEKISGVKETIGLGTIDFVRRKQIKEWLSWLRKKPISMHDFENFQNEIEGFISGLDADVRNNHFEALKNIKKIKSISEKPEVQALKTNNIWGDINDAWIGISARIDNISNFKTWIIEALIIYNQKLVSLLNSIKQKIIGVEELKAKKDLLEKNSDIVLQQYNKFMEMAKSLLDQKETTYQGLVNKLMEQIQAQNEVIKKLTLELNRLKEEQKEFVRKSDVQLRPPFKKYEVEKEKKEEEIKEETKETSETEDTTTEEKSSKEEDQRTYPSKYPFHELDNVVMTPHIAWKTPESMNNMLLEIAKNIERLYKGQELINIVNKDLGY